MTIHRAAILSLLILTLPLCILSACSGGEPKPAPSAAPADAAPSPAAAQAPSQVNAPPPAAATPQTQSAPEPFASTDIDTPTPLTAKSVSGTGIKKAVSYFYSLAADAGSVTLTATAKNAPAGSATALRASLLTLNADRLCLIDLGNSTADKKESTACAVEKAQPLVLRLDLDEATIDFTLSVDGPVRLAAPGTAAAAGAPVAGPGSTDIDAPTRLTSPTVAGSGTGQPVSYFYALNAGPGEVRLIADGRNRSTGTADALQLRLLTLRTEEICRVSLGNVTRDDRKIVTCRMDAREPVILRADIDPNTIDWRARVEGAVDFEPFTPPKVITIALNERVLFDSGKSALKPESRQTLHEASARVKKFGAATVTIAGHTDNVGSDAANMTLSEQRAAAVRDYFVQQEGIPAARLDVKGFGRSQPVAENTTPEGRARNRRVEVVIAPK